MSFAFKTPNSIIVDTNSFYIGTTGFNTTTLPSNENKITAGSNGAANDEFGNAVAVGFGKIIVGVAEDDVGSNLSQGSAYIFDLNGNQLGIITASDGAQGDRFGYSVAVGSGRIVVGAHLDDVGSKTDQGSAYIFDLDGNQLEKITASDGLAGDRFGISVAVGSGRIVVGSRDSVGSNTYQGSAYIYDLDGNQLTKITASDGATGDFFGYSVAVGSGRIVVGAYSDDVGINTDQGSAYIYDLDGNQLGIITASDGAAYDRFGGSVAVGDGRIVVGAYQWEGDFTNQGSAYIFDLNGNQLGIITASDGAFYDYFGYSVAVGCGRIVVGAYRDDYNGSLSGSAYIFDLDGNQLGIITASDGASSDFFGYSVAVGDGRIVVGAYGNDIGSNTDQGSAYIYETPKQIHYLDQLEGR